MRTETAGSIALFLMLCLDAPAAAQRPDVSGVVTDPTGRPVDLAEVTLLGLGAARTDSAGRFAFSGVPAGVVMIRVQRIGYSPILRTIVYDGVHPQTLELAFGQAVMLAPVVIRDSASSARDLVGFEQRRRSGLGTYLTEQEIAHRHAARAEHLLQMMQGVRVDSGGVVRVDRGRTSFLAETCSDGVQVFIDGVAVSSSYTLRNIPAEAIRGIEVYRGPATTPSELRSSRMACGTVAIWTK